MFRPASIVATAVLLAAPAHAQDRIAQIDEIFSFATPQTPGCAVGVSQHGNLVVDRAYGLADVERKLPLTQSSAFDIGSVQKQFTAAAVLLLVEDGRLSLSDDVRKHLPQLPDYGHRVTVDNLLTHTGGIRDWTGLRMLADGDPDVLTLIQRQRGLNFRPGEEWSYSSSGFELAKEIVARVSGMSFAEFARRRLFEPLGMKSSAYVPDITEAGANAALAYQKDGAGWKPYMRLGNNRGGGAIASTVGDLIIWNDALASGKLGRFVTDKLHEQTRLSNGRTLKYARGLMVDHTPGGLVVSHSGGAAGFSTWTGRVPEHGLSVAVACNFEPVSATALAARVSDLYLPPLPAAGRAPATNAANAPVVDVSDRAGLFFHDRTGEPMRLLVQDGRLRIANGPALVAVAQNRFRPARADLFFRSQDEFQLTFPSPDQLQITSMEGQVTRYRRAQPWTPAAADLQSVEGRYESTELGSVFEVLPGTNNDIVMRFERTPERALNLAPVERDTYMLSMMVVRFLRDASGKVVGFEYGNPVVRSIRFTRLGDRIRDADRELPGERTEPDAATPSASAAEWERYAGEYVLQLGPRTRGLRVFVEEGRLMAELEGQGTSRLLPRGERTFVAAVDEDFRFVFSPEDPARPVTLHVNGREVPGARKTP